MEKRYEVREVQMFDVIDTVADDTIILNTRDREHAEQFAAEHEQMFGTEAPPPDAA